MTHARNIVSARIWADIVKSRAEYTKLPELLRTSPNQGAVDGFPITVYGNGYYQGRYTLNIPKDKWMTNMDDSLDNHCILCSEEYESGCFRNNNVTWSDEIHDVMPDSIRNSFSDIIDFVMTSDDAEFKSKLNNHFYVDSLVDYYIFQYVICGIDSMGKNQLMFTYDGIKWIASSYDMDSTFGLSWTGGTSIPPTCRMQADYESGQMVTGGNLLYSRVQDNFVNEIKTRYAELRKNILSIPHIINRFEEFMQICPQDVLKEDYANTTGEGKFTEIPSQSTNNIQQIRQFIIDRINYVDSCIESLSTPIHCEKIVMDSTLEITTNSPVTLTATPTPLNTTDTITWSSSDNEIATVNNGVITPIKNGNVVIKVFCGEQEASCQVTISGILGRFNIIGDSSEVKMGNTLPLTARNTTDTITWSSSDNEIATVNNGVITPIKNGIATISASYVADNNINSKYNIRISKKYEINYNLFNDGVVNDDNKYYGDNGKLDTETGQRSVLIPVQPGIKITKNFEGKIAYFNAKKEFISISEYISDTSIVIDLPYNCFYIGVNYTMYITNPRIIVAEYIDITNNLFNCNELSEKYFDVINETWKDDSNYVSSKYIEVSGGNKLKIACYQGAIFNQNKQKIASIVFDRGNTGYYNYTLPSNAKYMVLTIENNLDKIVNSGAFHVL